MELLYSPWMNRFLQAVAEAREEILLVSPFIKLSLVRPLLLALPTDREIRITVVTRLSPQTFQQLSSDVAAIELLHARPGIPGSTSVYRLDRLHAKIYVFDRQRVFLGSSNLSITGMERNLESVLTAVDENLARRILQGLEGNTAFKRQVGTIEFRELRLRLGEEVIPLETPVECPSLSDDESTLVDQAPTDSSAGPAEDLAGAEGATVARQEAIQEFLATRFRSDLNSLSGVPFESPIARGRQRPEDRLPDEVEKIRAAAIRDLDRIARTLLPVLGASDSTWREAGLAIFVHQSWCNEFPDLLRDGFQRQRFGTLGRAVVAFEISLHFVKHIAFEATSAGAASICTQTTAADLPYDEILDQKGLNVALHSGEVARANGRDLFTSIVGFQYIVKGAETVHEHLKAILADELSWRRVDDAIEDPKTHLQKVAQKKGWSFRYEVERAGGTEHQPVFESYLRVGMHRYGPFRADSKKRAEMGIAAEVVKVLDPDDECRPRPSGVAWRPYHLDEDRRQQCAELAQRLDLQPRNSPSLLDLALTHMSYQNEIGSARSYQRLAFVGSQLLPVLGASHFLKSAGWQNKEFESQRKGGMEVLGRELLPPLFDRLCLGKVLRFGKGLAAKPILASIKVEVMQAIFAVAFYWHGMSGAEGFWNRHVWTALRDHCATEIEVNPISSLQERTGSGEAPRYVVDPVPGRPVHEPIFRARCFLGGELAGTGTGQSKSSAKRAAAVEALRWLELKECT